MSKIAKLSILTLFLGLISFSSCQKDELEDTNLPNPDQKVTDLGKMSAFVKTGFWKAAKYSAVYSNNILKIDGVNSSNDTIRMVVAVYPNGTIYYPFYKNQFNCGGYFNGSIDTLGYYSTRYYSDEENAGYIRFTDFDLLNNLISGNFAFRCSKEGSNSQLPITEGKFTNLKLDVDTSYKNKMAARIIPDSVNCSVTIAYDFNNNIVIDGWYSSTKRIAIMFSNQISEGDSLIIGASVSSGTASASLISGNTADNGLNGYVKITKKDSVNNVVKAVFDITTNAGTHIKNGAFDIKYFK